MPRFLGHQYRYWPGRSQIKKGANITETKSQRAVRNGRRRRCGAGEDHRGRRWQPEGISRNWTVQLSAISRAAQMLNGPQLKLLEAWSSKRKNAPVEAIPKNGNEVAKPKRSSLRQRADPASHHLKPTHWAGRRATEGEPTPATPRDCAVQDTNGQVMRPYGRVRQTYWRLPPAHGAKSAPSRWSRSCRR
jgi:hypothetical protein